MKTNNPENYRLVSSVFKKYCRIRKYKPYNNAVTFEHGGFSCTADGGDKDVYFRAVDAACLMCGTADYCSFCGRYCQIDFEEVG